MKVLYICVATDVTLACDDDDENAHKINKPLVKSMSYQSLGAASVSRLISKTSASASRELQP